MGVRREGQGAGAFAPPPPPPFQEKKALNILHGKYKMNKITR